jgi:hypothetical protein
MKHDTSFSWTTVGVASLVLAAADIGAIVVAFGLFIILRPLNQVLFQGLVAAVLVCAACALAQETFHQVISRWTHLWPALAWLGLQVGALACGALLLIPLHFAARGYLTSLGNLVGLWVFQLPTNGVGLLLLAYLASRSSRAWSSF